MSGAFPQNEISQIITEAVASPTLPPSLHTLLLIPLRQRGKVLHPSGEHAFWPSLVLATASAASGDRRIAAHVGAAVEIFMAALDVFDEVEDGDRSELIDAVGVPQATNVATSLTLLAQQTILALADTLLPLERVLSLTHTLTAAGIEATGGQHRDLAAEGDRTISAAEAHAIAQQKAGVLAAGAATLGALLGTVDPAILEHYRAWGLHLGTLAQLQNDIRDAGAPTVKSDLARGKGTLPLIYARGTAGAEGATLADNGALHFAWVVREIERQGCEEAMAQIAAHDHTITPLRDLLTRLG